MWFDALGSAAPEEVRNRCDAFLHALLSTTLLYLRKIRDEKRLDKNRLQIIASEFRNRMADGRTFAEHGPYRTRFYDDVYSRANKVLLPPFPNEAGFLTSPSEYRQHYFLQSTFHPR